jgi:hypothetical protein
VVLGLALLGASVSVSAEENPARLGARLARATGPERVSILAALVAANANDQPAKAIEQGNEAQRMLQGSSDRKTRLRVANDLRWAYNVQGDYEDALQLGEQAGKPARGVGDTVAEERAGRWWSSA